MGFMERVAPIVAQAIIFENGDGLRRNTGFHIALVSYFKTGRFLKIAWE
jgi:hypothetical protein